MIANAAEELNAVGWLFDIFLAPTLNSPNELEFAG